LVIGEFPPFYENYGADTILSGADPVYVPLHPPNFEFDPVELRRAFGEGVKALVLCSPSNPTGKVFTHSELRYNAELAREFDTFVITDERKGVKRRFDHFDSPFANKSMENPCLRYRFITQYTSTYLF